MCVFQTCHIALKCVKALILYFGAIWRTKMKYYILDSLTTDAEGGLSFLLANFFCEPSRIKKFQLTTHVSHFSFLSLVVYIKCADKIGNRKPQTNIPTETADGHSNSYFLYLPRTKFR